MEVYAPPIDLTASLKLALLRSVGYSDRGVSATGLYELGCFISR